MGGTRKSSKQRKMIEELKSRFGQDAVKRFKKIDDNLELLLIELKTISPTVILLTHGLAAYEMPVHEKYTGREYNELFFCLPSYWDINEEENSNRNWPIAWLIKLANHVREKNAWFGPGHTIQCYPDFAPISSMLSQNHFLLVDPILLKKEMASIIEEGKEIHFLGIVPIYGDEMDFKQAKGTAKLLQKLENKKVNEKLDDWRENVLKSRWKFRR